MDTYLLARNIQCFLSIQLQIPLCPDPQPIRACNDDLILTYCLTHPHLQI